MHRWNIFFVVVSSVGFGACSSGKDAAATGGAGKDAAADGGAGASEGGPAAAAYDLALQFSGEVNGGSSPWSYGSTDRPGGAFTPFTINSHAAAGSAVPFLYGYNTIDPTVTASGGDLIGWNGSDGNPSRPADTTFYPYILKNIGTTPFVLQSNTGAGSGISVPSGQIYAHSGAPATILDARFTAPKNLTAHTIHAQFDRLQNSTTIFSQTVLVFVNASQVYSKVLSGNGASTSFTSVSMDLKTGDTVDFLLQPVPDFSGASMAITAQIATAFDGGTTD